MNLVERKDNKHWQMFKLQNTTANTTIQNNKNGEIYYINKATKEMESIQNQEENSYDDELLHQDEH